MTKKIVVTGATGQDGSYMIEYLLANTQDTIIAAIRRTSQAILSNLKGVLDNPRVKLVTLDLNDVHSISILIRDEKPDYFINFGASAFVPDSWNSPAQVMNTNAISLIHILEAVRQYAPQCRVYSSGSSEQWGNVLYSPQDENHPPRPRSIYGVSKVAAGMICKVYRESYGLYVVHGVLLNHESERRQEYYVTRKITKGVARISKAISEGQSFDSLELGNWDAQRDWSHSLDVIDGVWKMLNQEYTPMDGTPAIDILDDEYREEFDKKIRESEEKTRKAWQPKEYVLSSGEVHSVREFVEKAFSVAGIEGWWMGEGVNETFKWHPYGARHDRSGNPESFWTLVKVNPAFYRPADVETLHGNSSKARSELGWSPKVSFDELVTRMVKHDLAEVGL